MGGGGLFGSEILVQSDFFGVYERRRDFLGREKKEGLFWVAKIGLRYFLGMLKKVVSFWVDKF